MSFKTLFSLQGNIGSGKSTLFKYLQDTLPNCYSQDLVFVDEPVDEWSNIKNSDNQSILELFYKNKKRYSFTFQMMAYITRLVLLRENIKQNKPNSLAISERSLYSDKHVFAKMLYDTGYMNKVEYTIYEKWFNEFNKVCKREKYIYIRTSPEIAYARILKRARQGETIPLDYIKKCHEYHENWLKNVDANNILIIDGDVNIYDCPEKLLEWRECIVDFLSR